MMMMMQCLLETCLFLGLLLLDALIGHHQKGHVKGTLQCSLYTGRIIVVVVVNIVVLLLCHCCCCCCCGAGGNAQFGLLLRRSWTTRGGIHMRRQIIHEQVHRTAIGHFEYSLNWILLLIFSILFCLCSFDSKFCFRLLPARNLFLFKYSPIATTNKYSDSHSYSASTWNFHIVPFNRNSPHSHICPDSVCTHCMLASPAVAPAESQIRIFTLMLSIALPLSRRSICFASCQHILWFYCLASWLASSPTDWHPVEVPSH